MINKVLAVAVLSCLCSITAVGETAIKKPILLHLVGADSLTSDLMLAGTPSQPVYFFRDPDGGRIRFERSGNFEEGFTRRYNYVNGKDAAYVEIRDFYIFHEQGLMWPYIISVNGVKIAGFTDSDVETKRLGKKVFAEFKKLPAGFQRALYNFCIFAEGVKGAEVDAGTTGILLSENWNSPGLPNYKVTVIPAPADDENAIPNFQRLFSD